jgi:HK97 family phage major capsid protein
VKISKAVRSFVEKSGHLNSSLTVGDDHKLVAEAVANALEDGTLSPEKFAELNNAKTPADVFGGSNWNVKKPSARYSSVKSVGKHARSGEQVLGFDSQPVELPSQKEIALSGAYFKHVAQKSGIQVAMSEHDSELLGECFEGEFCGKVGSDFITDMPGARAKTLLNDSLSGGAEIVPIHFDSAVITYPLLHSEFLPKIDLQDVPRGRNIETAAIGNPTASWGTPEGTAISPFDTASLITGIDTTIHNVSVAVEIGRDFLSDAAADVGRILLEVIGQRMLSELDRVIVVGNGTTEPQGIFNASGLNDIGNPATGAGGVASVDDMEALYFSVGKAYRTASLNCCFFSNDVSYRRNRTIEIGASDQRRVWGMDYASYKMMDMPYLVCNSIGNQYIGFGAMKRYRLFRRLSQSVQFTSEGRELALKNQTLLVVRGRYGGKVMDANAFSFTDNAQA